MRREGWGGGGEGRHSTGVGGHVEAVKVIVGEEGGVGRGGEGEGKRRHRAAVGGIHV